MATYFPENTIPFSQLVGGAFPEDTALAELRRQQELEAERLRKEEEERLRREEEERRAAIEAARRAAEEQRQAIEAQSRGLPQDGGALAPLSQRLQSDPNFIRAQMDSEVQRVLAEEEAKQRTLAQQKQTETQPLSALARPQEFQGMGKYGSAVEYWLKDPKGFAQTNPMAAQQIAQAEAGLPAGMMRQLMSLQQPVYKQAVIDDGRPDPRMFNTSMAFPNMRRPVTSSVLDTEATMANQAKVGQMIQAEQDRRMKLADAELKRRKDMLGLAKDEMELRGGKAGKQDETATFARNYAIYETLPEGSMKEAFGQKFGLIPKDKAAEAALLAATPGTPQNAAVERAKAKREEEVKKLTSGNEYALEGIGQLENRLAKILGVQESQLPDVLGGADVSRAAGAIAPAAGPIQGRLPYATTLSPFQVSDIRSNIENLKQLAQTYGLEGMKARGVSPGSITVAEWPKFAARLANIDLTLSDEKLAQELADIYKGAQARKGELTAGIKRVREQAEQPATAPAKTAQSGAQREAALRLQADEAIRRGANPEQVQQRLNQMLKGQ